MWAFQVKSTSACLPADFALTEQVRRTKVGFTTKLDLAAFQKLFKEHEKKQQHEMDTATFLNTCCRMF